MLVQGVVIQEVNKHPPENALEDKEGALVVIQELSNAIITDRVQVSL